MDQQLSQHHTSGRMTMRRHLITAVAAIALALALAAPVAADPASYPGCSNFGAVQTGDIAPHGVLGAMISSLAPTSDLLGPGTRISDIVTLEHGAYCAHP